VFAASILDIRRRMARGRAAASAVGDGHRAALSSDHLPIRRNSMRTDRAENRRSRLRGVLAIRALDTSSWDRGCDGQRVDRVVERQ